MHTKIEDYIKEHKEDFDTEMPSGGLWAKIDGSLQKDGSLKKVKPTNGIRVWMSVAAALVVIATGIFFYNSSPDQDQSLRIADVNPAYARKQLRFASLIERKTDSLEILAKQNPQLYQKFSADLQQIQVDYKQLRHEFPLSANQALVVKAMEKNLELQLQVVSQQLTIINQVNQYRKDNQL
jgi:hypothetical protein